MDVSGTDILVVNMHILPKAIRNSGLTLEESGWKVIIVWECELRHEKDFSILIERLSLDIRSQDSNLGTVVKRIKLYNELIANVI